MYISCPFHFQNDDDDLVAALSTDSVVVPSINCGAACSSNILLFESNTIAVPSANAAAVEVNADDSCRFNESSAADWKEKPSHDGINNSRDSAASRG